MNLLVGHLVGDFLIQNDWMAINKKKETLPCLVHVSLYTLSIWAFTQWPWWALLITFVCHFIQDRTPVINWFFKVTGKPEFGKPPMAPWSFIVVDNSFHLLQLYLTGLLVTSQILG